MDLGGELVIGQAAAGHPYSVPGTGATAFQVTVTVVGRPECVTTVDVEIDNCPSAPSEPPEECPVEQVTLRVADSNGIDVTPRIEAGECLSPGQYVVRADIVPAGATTAFAWRVDGFAATIGQTGVVAITGAQLTIDLTTSFQSVSVIAARCASDGVDLRPCEKACCPDLTGLSASCMPRCPPSTTVTLTATGSDLECAEAFDWEFGDGTTSETVAPTTTHIYESFGVFDASVTIVRPRECGRPRPPARTRHRKTMPGIVLLRIPGDCERLPAARLSGADAADLLFTRSGNSAGVDRHHDHRGDFAGDSDVVVASRSVLSTDAVRAPENSYLGFYLGAHRPRLHRDVLRRLASFRSGSYYAVAQQIFLRMINEGNCGPAPDMFTWPFPACR